MNKHMTRRSWLGAAGMFAVSGVAAGQEDFTKLPPNLPVPMDDGACDHLLHMQVPTIPLNATVGGTVSLPAVKAERTIVYCYPRTGEPGKPSPDGWDAIPGARGCTPQSCSMRDNYHVIRPRLSKLAFPGRQFGQHLAALPAAHERPIAPECR